MNQDNFKRLLPVCLILYAAIPLLVARREA